MIHLYVYISFYVDRLDRYRKINRLDRYRKIDREMNVVAAGCRIPARSSGSNPALKLRVYGHINIQVYMHIDTYTYIYVDV